MELGTPRHTIIVACHQEPISLRLERPYIEVCVQQGERKPVGYEHYVSREVSDLIYPEAWSEVEVLLDLKSFVGDSKIVGLQHYRRIFALMVEASDAVIPMKMSHRNQFVAAQADHLLSYTHEVIIPRKWEFTSSAYDQFLEYKPELEGIFSFGLVELDSLLYPYFGRVNSKSILQNTSFLYPLNMFIGSIEFFEEWHEILSELVESIERVAPEFKDSLTARWGGYLAERFFSVYIYLCQESNRWAFVEQPVAIFELEDRENLN